MNTDVNLEKVFEDYNIKEVKDLFDPFKDKFDDINESRIETKNAIYNNTNIILRYIIIIMSIILILSLIISNRNFVYISTGGVIICIAIVVYNIIDQNKQIKICSNLLLHAMDSYLSLLINAYVNKSIKDFENKELGFKVFKMEKDSEVTKLVNMCRDYVDKNLI